MPASLPCHQCRHFLWASLESDRCAAFLEGVPDEIWLGNVSHTEPFPGDGGLRHELQQPGPAGNVQRRHDAWAKRPVERFAHEADRLGAIVARFDSAPLSVRLDASTLREAWHATNDAPAMLLVLLRARRADALARAVHLTSSQLAAEGCDYLDNKSWLGVTLCLGSYQTEAAFANARAAWSALSVPFGDGYLTARVHQILVRNIRRVVPEPPPASEWASSELEIEGVGPLDDAVVAMRLTPQNKATRVEDVVLLDPWTAVTNAQGLEAELARELAPGHRLFGRSGLRAIARRADSDVVLFANDMLAAVVSLTWAKVPDPAGASPVVEIFASLDDWLSQRMNVDHDAFAGQAPRAFAFEFRSTLTLEEMKDQLPDRVRWEWTAGQSAWYGDYLWAKDGSTRLRIFSEDEPERFAVQADLVDSDDRGAEWFSATRALVVDSFLPAVRASDVVETTPEYD